MKKDIIFLYLNGTHQLFHTAMTAFECSRLQKEFNVKLIACHPEHYEILNKMRDSFGSYDNEIVLLPFPFKFKYLNFKKKSYPSPYSTIKLVRNHLNNSVVVISTSHDLPKLLKKINYEQLKKIYQFHGCGDRSYSFDPEYRNFDLLLIPGKYHEKRLISEKIVNADKIRIVGYPKLDIPNNQKNGKTSFFNNKNPTILYTPHWDPELSSYKEWSREIIDYFKLNQQYNLILAPHIQLKHWKFKYGYDTNFDISKASNILIDFESINSVNGTYLYASDIYIGDVSSQVYEFLAVKPRSCIFLNPKKLAWKNNPDFKFWELGNVIEDFNEFDTVLSKSILQNFYSELQSNRLKSYISVTKQKPSQRAAEAILEFANNFL